MGFGIRLAQDVGAHRRKGYQDVPTAEDEQWKRGFWYVILILSFPTLSNIRRVLVCMDRMISTAMGQPCAIHDEEYV